MRSFLLAPVGRGVVEYPEHDHQRVAVLDNGIRFDFLSDRTVLSVGDAANELNKRMTSDLLSRLHPHLIRFVERRKPNGWTLWLFGGDLYGLVIGICDQTGIAEPPEGWRVLRETSPNSQFEFRSLCAMSSQERKALVAGVVAESAA